VKNGKVRAHFLVATTEEELLAARGSKYVQTRFSAEALPLMRSFEGRLAVVGLPCDLTILKNHLAKDSALAEKVVFTIGLLCGHNSRPELIDTITARLEKDAGSQLRDFRFRVGHWRGMLQAEFESGAVLTKPTKYFNDYQNLFFFSERKCMACHDHYAYDADISTGDVWLYSLRDDPIKHTGAIIRTDRADALYASACESGAVATEPLDIRRIMDGQARIAPAHYNVSARARVGRLFGLRISDSVGERVSWHAYLNALITVANMRLSENRWGKKLIFAMPRSVWKLLLYLKKGLESLH
jgi:coenzyme F420-reducing hydrogenase beta subunit